jgi:hypothetical protein
VLSAVLVGHGLGLSGWVLAGAGAPESIPGLPHQLRLGLVMVRVGWHCLAGGGWGGRGILCLDERELQHGANYAARENTSEQRR